jgi:hypothetical protein
MLEGLDFTRGGRRTLARVGLCFAVHVTGLRVSCNHKIAARDALKQRIHQPGENGGNRSSQCHRFILYIYATIFFFHASIAV